MAKISKQKVKGYLDHDGKELSDAMKKNMDDNSGWNDFKNELVASVVEYSAHPTLNSRQRLYDLMSLYFSNKVSFGKDAVEMLLEDLGIKELQLVDDKSVSSNKELNSIAYRRKVFEALGLEFPDDIVARREREWQERQDAKYGIIKKKKSLEKAKEDKREPKTDKDKSDEPKEEGALKKALKVAYFKITASSILAPGEVPAEILAENKELLSQAEEKLAKVTEELKKARDIIINQNNSSLSNIPDDIKESYEQMVNGKFDEDALDAFSETLDSKSQEEIDSMRTGLEKAQKQKLEDSLRSLLEEKGIEGQELEDEIEYAVLDSKVDENGALILPARSIFKDIFSENDGNITAVKADIVKTMLSTYVTSPKVSELSDEEVVILGRNIRKLNVLAEGRAEESKHIAVAKYFRDYPEMLPDDVALESIVNEIEKASQEQIAVERIHNETELRHKTIIAEEIQGQFQEIDERIAEYDEKETIEGSLSKEEAKKRAIALKIARLKVGSLEKAGLSKVIDEGEKKSKGLLKRAKGILIPELENARDKGTKRFKKEFAEPEEEKGK